MLFLPGASGKAEFWQPVAELLDGPDHGHDLLGWPGVGGNPPDPDVGSYRDLTRLAKDRLIDSEVPDQPQVVVAQSMGGVAAVSLALEHPELVRGLVLTATSGGIDVAALGGIDWRSGPRTAPRWVYERPADVSQRLPGLAVPTLLIWADRDAISPLGVGRELERLIPNSSLEVVDSDDHMFASTRAAEVAPLIQRFLDDQDSSITA